MFDDYLHLLGVSHQPPSLAALMELVAAHLYTAPFENVSKVYYKKHLGLNGIPSLEQYLDGMEYCHFGGTCYSNNFYLNQLLRYLGYNVRLCGADMNNPDVHLVNIVEVDSREFLVDVGYGAPFDRPLPRDLTSEYVLTHGRNQYVLKPQDTRGYSSLETIRDGQIKHGYWTKPAPRQIEEFCDVITQSYRAEATFMNSLLIARFFPERSLVVRNFTVTETTGSDSQTFTLSTNEALAAYITEHFEMPQAIVLDVLSELREMHGDA
jgi:arylamine N-acetyltransferase